MVKVDGKTSGISLHYTKHKGNNAGVNGLQRHNERKPGQKHSNKKIKDQRTEDNVFLKSAPKTYYNTIKDKITENRKNGMKGVRKDAVRMVEATVQLSGKVLDQPEEKQEEVLRDMYEWLKDEHGEDNIVSAVIHKDETSMHLHFDFVPITEEGKLSAKEILSKGKLKYKQDSSLKHVQDKHPAMHFKRGGGETKGLSQKDFETFKAMQEDLEQSMNEYSDALDEQEEELDAREDWLDERTASLADREETLNEKEGTLNKNAYKVRKMYADVQEREKQVTTRENTQNEREKAYMAKLSRLSDKEDGLVERERGLNATAERLSDWESLLRTQKTTLDEREREVDEKDQGADEKLSEAQNKLDSATEKEESATDKLSTAEKLLEEVTRKLSENEERLAEIAKENQEKKDLMKEFKRFGNRFMAMVDAVRNGEIGKRTAARVSNNLETPFDNQENLEHNNLVFDELEEQQGNGLQL